MQGGDAWGSRAERAVRHLQVNDSGDERKPKFGWAGNTTGATLVWEFNSITVRARRAGGHWSAPHHTPLLRAHRLQRGSSFSRTCSPPWSSST